MNLGGKEMTEFIEGGIASARAAGVSGTRYLNNMKDILKSAAGIRFTATREEIQDLALELTKIGATYGDFEGVFDKTSTLEGAAEVANQFRAIFGRSILSVKDLYTAQFDGGEGAIDKMTTSMASLVDIADDGSLKMSNLSKTQAKMVADIFGKSAGEMQELAKEKKIELLKAALGRHAELSFRELSGIAVALGIDPDVQNKKKLTYMVEQAINRQRQKEKNEQSNQDQLTRLSIAWKMLLEILTPLVIDLLGLLDKPLKALLEFLGTMAKGILGDPGADFNSKFGEYTSDMSNIIGMRIANAIADAAEQANPFMSDTRHQRRKAERDAEVQKLLDEQAGDDRQQQHGNIMRPLIG